MVRALPCLLLALAAPAIADDDMFMFDIPVASEESGLLGDRVALTLSVPQGRRAADIIEAAGALKILSVDGQEVRLEIPRRPTFPSDPTEQHLASSFVIDYDSDVVAEVANKLADGRETAPDIEELTLFVRDYISEKEYAGTFEFASEVAESRSGDCTEHAVLLAALARHFGYPARVSLGVTLIDDGENRRGVGHAWTEIHDGRSWQLADAALYTSDESAANMHYLPLYEMNNEGPSYALDMMAMMHVHPAAVSDIKTVSNETKMSLPAGLSPDTDKSL